MCIRDRGPLGQRAVQADQVGFLQQFFQRNVAGKLFHFGVFVHVIAEHIHAKTVADAQMCIRDRQRISYTEYLLDILLYGEIEEKAALIAAQGKEMCIRDRNPPMI